MKGAAATMEEQPTPPRRRCGTMASHQLLLEIDEGFRERQRELEDVTARRMTLGTAALMAVGPITIPVVVHVVYNTRPENISTAQIKSQIAVLNKDFRAKNPDKSKAPAVWQG